MNIVEMHQTFRVIAQKAGMQLSRSILPEEIDVFINLAIEKKVKQEIELIASTQFPEDVATKDNSLTTLNYLKDLVIVDNVNVNTTLPNFSNNLTKNPIAYLYFIVVYGNSIETYKCRFIEPDKYDMTVRDFCNKPSREYPVVTLRGNELIFNNGVSQIENKTLKVGYIREPNKVSLNSNKDCDLPTYDHYNIVQLAVSEYISSLVNTTV